VVALRCRLAAWLAVSLAAAHPLHTSVTELGIAGNGTVALTVRVFADDFVAAAGEGDSAASAYVRQRLVLTDRRGVRLALRWEGSESRGDAVILRLSALAPGALTGTEARNTLLCERFDDQVNIMRVSAGSRAATLLFTRNSGPQPLP
jgi:hypothetical protein